MYTPRTFPNLLFTNRLLLALGAAFSVLAASAFPTVKISVVDPSATEAPTPVPADPAKSSDPAIDSAVFEISREDDDLTRDVLVFFSIHGTAGNGRDYVEIKNQATITAGQNAVRIEIVPLVDMLTVVEPMETVGLRLEESPLVGPAEGYTIDQNARAAIAVIYEMQPPADGAVEIGVPAPEFTYLPGDEIHILAAFYNPDFDLAAANAVAPTVEYFANDVKIGSSEPASSHGALHLHFFHWQDAPAGGHLLTARATAPDGAQLHSSSIKIRIPSDGTPLVGIRFVPHETDEAWPDADFAPGSFEIDRTGSTAEPLMVFFDVGGTATPGEDYERLIHSVIIPEGQSAVRIFVKAIDDLLDEPEETVALKLTPVPPNVDPAYPANYIIDPNRNSAELLILDNDDPPADLPVVSIAAIWPHTAEPSADTPSPAMITPGLFRLTRTGPTIEPLTVALRYEGSATPKLDYEELPSTVTFAAGSSESDLKVLPMDDDLVEGEETVVAALAPMNASAYIIHKEHSSATVVIFDAEPGERATIRITAPQDGEFFRAGATITIDAVAVDPNGYIGRVDFYANDRKIGTSEILFLVAPPPGTPIHHTFEWNDVPAGNYRLTVRGEDSKGNLVVSAPVGIHVNDGPAVPVVSIKADPEEIIEPTPVSLVRPGKFIVSRTGPTDLPLRVHLEYSGTATMGADYEELPRFVLIPENSASVEILVLAKVDNLVEETETIIARIAPPLLSTDPDPANTWYQIDPDGRAAFMKILDSSSTGRTIVRVSTLDSEATEFPPNADGFDPARFLISRSGDLNQELRVFFSIHGTAVNGEDYQKIAESVSIPAGKESVEIEIVPIGDLPPPVVNHYEIVSQPGITWEDARAAAAERTFNGIEGHLATVKSSEEADRIDALRVEGNFGELWLGGHQPTERTSPTEGWEWVNNEGPIPGNNDGPRYANWQPGEPNDYWGPGSENYLSTGWLNSAQWNDEGQVGHVQGYVVEYELPVPMQPLAERMETVGIRLERPLLVTPVETYDIDPQARQAGAVIYDFGPPREPELEIVVPGAGYTYRREVEFLAAGYHPDEAVYKVDFYVDGRLVGSSEIFFIQPPTGGLLFHSFKWENPVAGHHVLVAKSTLASGEISSSQIPFVVDGPLNQPPRVRIAKPADGAVFLVGESFKIAAEAADPDGTIRRLDVSVGTLGVTTEASKIEFDWAASAPGRYTITARAVDNLGAESSTRIQILVRDSDDVAFVHRDLPGGYAPGQTFTVQLKTTPPDRSSAYAVEDRPPAGWQVRDISHEGAFDLVTGKVKFGPYFDARERLLTYRITPPANASGRYEFTGNSSINGAVYPIAGDRFIEQVESYHPADRDEDYAIRLVELTGYGAAWKQGESWPVGPVPIPLSYVTRAGMIWKRGEAYRFDASLGEPPRCWVPSGGGPERQSLAGTTTAERQIIGQPTPGAATQVRIVVSPAAGTVSYAVEERVPTGWTVAEISAGGTFDAHSGCIRWGLFLDANPRTLTYSITPPAQVSTVGRFSGQVSADGQTTEITSGSSLVASQGASVEFVRCAVDSSGAVRLQISGAPGQTGVVQASTDFANWLDLGSVFLPNGTAEFIDNSPGSNENRFYRLHVQ